MTVQHIVLLKAREGVSDSEMDDLMLKVQQLQTIPDVGSISAGKNFNDRKHGYNYGAVMTFSDKAALRAYLEHPEHQVMSVEVKRMCADILTFDFED